ncbi:MAG: hypothetical protein NW224_30025 [Leptolyngbyaceae cyanobacterium bins.302]|nr:hypothetical protein [Leptolyngbyaceae cyanobacterium bins.302]
MITNCGKLFAPIEGPIIYFIVAYDVLYIGETQHHPVERWNAHLSPKGSFRTNLLKKGDPEIDYFGDLRLFAYYCQTITQNFPKVQWKTVTQAVEHEAHGYVLQYPSRIGKYYNVISDTEKTAPSRFKHWDLAKRIAGEILQDLAIAMNSNS